jgi:double-stranded uracil-DNA glycosylase
MPAQHKPTPDELRAAVNKTMPDIIAPRLRVLFCGINPSVYSVVVGHHFARPGNRFWKAIYGGGFTPRLLRPDEDILLPQFGCGITNVVDRATVAAAELSNEELIEGGRILAAKVAHFQPQWLAVLGITAYRSAFGKPHAQLGLQSETIGNAQVWILPNPSGLNAHYQIADLARLFGELKEVSFKTSGDVP